MIEKVLLKIRQHFCRHKYTKNYDTKKKCYAYRCVKCGKSK